MSVDDGNFPQRTMELLLSTLVAGFDGFELDNGTLLAAGRNPERLEVVSDDLLPFILFENGSIRSTPWQAWADYVTWDIPATLKVKGPPEDVDTRMLDVVRQVMQRTAELIGLPVDANGVVVPFTPASAQKFDRDELMFVANYAGPFLSSVGMPPAQGSYAIAPLVFHVEATIDNDPRGELPKALQARFGVVPMLGSLAQDSTLPEPAGIPIVPMSARMGIGGYNTPDPMLKTRQPPLQQAAGVATADTLQSLSVMPYAATLTSGAPTIQLAAIATYANWQTNHVEQLGAWVSSTPSVATISATGLVTRVATGSTSISFTFGGASSSVAVTCT